MHRSTAPRAFAACVQRAWRGAAHRKVGEKPIDRRRPREVACSLGCCRLIFAHSCGFNGLRNLWIDYAAKVTCFKSSALLKDCSNALTLFANQRRFSWRFWQKLGLGLQQTFRRF